MVHVDGRARGKEATEQPYRQNRSKRISCWRNLIQKLPRSSTPSENLQNSKYNSDCECHVRFEKIVASSDPNWSSLLVVGSDTTV